MSRLLDRVLDPARAERIAIEGDQATAPVTYRALAERARALGRRLGGGPGGLRGAPVAFLYPPGAAHVEALLGVMAAGGLAVPLSPLHTRPELQQLLADAAPTRVLCAPELRDRLPPELPCPLELDPAVAPGSADPPVADDADGLMLFTSGTTGRPKGVVSSHGALAACVESLHQAWGWRPDDRLLHVLPLHHTHGVVVALLGALWAGASVRFGDARPEAIWRAFTSASVFMGVPSIHARLLEAFTAAGADDQRPLPPGGGGPAPGHQRLGGAAPVAAGGIRPGDRAAPAGALRDDGDWDGAVQPARRPARRRDRGARAAGREVDIVDEQERPCGVGQPGELRVRSPQMFTRYHRDAQATAAAFDSQGRFRTGDTGLREATGWVRLLGRTSVDVLKSGGYKLSALEIEEALRGHPAVADVAVIGEPDPVWGDRVTACVVLRAGTELSLSDLQTFAREHLAPYKLPRALRVLPELPRNAMGKVQKTRLK